MSQRQASRARRLERLPGAWRFGYSGEDYSRASMYFLGIEQRFGITDLLRIYERIGRRREAFLTAAAAELVLKPRELESLAAKAAAD